MLRIQPLAVEEEFALEFENVPYTLKGYLDLVGQNKTIRDTKTAKRSYPKTGAQTDIQLTAYNLALLEIVQIYTFPFDEAEPFLSLF